MKVGSSLRTVVPKTTIQDATRELSASLGVALLGGVFLAGYNNAIKSRLAGLPAEAAQAACCGIADALAIAGQGRPYFHALYRLAQETFVQGWQQALWAGVAVMAMLCAFVLAHGPDLTSANVKETADAI